MSSKFDLIVEAAITRYQNQGILVSDLVKFRDGYANDDFIKGLGENTKQAITNMIESGDNIRVSAIKTDRPTTADASNFGAVNGFFCDVIHEQAPGLYMNPITVPMGLLEIIDTGINLSGKTPDSQVKKDPTNIKPVKVKENEIAPQAFKGATKLPDKNTTLPGAAAAKTAQYTTKYMEK